MLLWYYILTRGLFCLLLLFVISWDTLEWWSEVKRRARENDRPLFPKATGQTDIGDAVLAVVAPLVPVVGEVLALILGMDVLVPIAKEKAEQLIRKRYGPKKDEEQA